jgi:hypothetical protein
VADTEQVALDEVLDEHRDFLRQRGRGIVEQGGHLWHDLAERLPLTHRFPDRRSGLVQSVVGGGIQVQQDRASPVGELPILHPGVPDDHRRQLDHGLRISGARPPGANPRQCYRWARPARRGDIST